MNCRIWEGVYYIKKVFATKAYLKDSLQVDLFLRWCLFRCSRLLSRRHTMALYVRLCLLLFGICLSSLPLLHECVSIIFTIITKSAEHFMILVQSRCSLLFILMEKRNYIANDIGLSLNTFGKNNMGEQHIWSTELLLHVVPN